MGLVLLAVHLYGQVALGWRAIGVGGQEVEDVLKAGAKFTAFRHCFDQDALLGHRDADAHLFGVSCPIGHSNLEDVLSNAGIDSSNKVVRQIEFESERTAIACLAGEIERLSALDIVDPSAQVYFSPTHRLAEKVRSFNLSGDTLPRMIEGLIRHCANPEFR